MRNLSAATMLPPPFDNALVLTGPTGAGKTRLAIEHAQRLGAEIISMDSMALYRGLNIGTAKPTPAERGRVPHHLVDVLDPWESASVAWWLDRAKACCSEIKGRGKRVLFAGGTPLYLKALLRGLFDGPPADPALRRALEVEATNAGAPALHERLARVDPMSAARLHSNDLRRVIRALEVFELTGKPISVWQSQWAEDRGQKSPVPCPPSSVTLSSVLWLDLPRPELYDRINRRVDAMFAAGLVDEVRQLLSLERPLSKEATQALDRKSVV